MTWYLFILFTFIPLINANYLTNNEYTVSYIDLPTNGIISSNYQFPYIRFGCNMQYKNTNTFYFVTSTYNSYYSSSESSNCGRSTKYVEIMKFNSLTKNFTYNIIIGSPTSQYPTAKGNLGSDNIVSCGIDETYNILYYIGSNRHNCPSSYNTDSSLVRINLTTFTFIDRTILRNIPNIPDFSIYNYWKYKYVNDPLTSQAINGHLWIGFGSYYTGIWKLNITGNTVNLMEYIQKTYYVEDDEMINSDGSKYKYLYTMRAYKHSFVIREEQMIYFVEDTGYKDATLLKINYTLPLNNNNTALQILDGITSITSINRDTFRKRFYIVSGLLTSEMYQYDYEFNKLTLSEHCNIDFLKFPTECGVITKIEVDPNTGFIYALVSTRHPFIGIVKISSKNLELD